MKANFNAARLDRSPRVLGVAAGLLLLVFALRLSVTTPGFGISLLYDVPVALVAVAYGFRAGIVAATVAFAFYALGEALAPIHTSSGSTLSVNAVGYLSRALVFYLLGGLLGLYSDSLRRNHEERRRAEQEISAQAQRLSSVETLARVREEERRRWARELHDQTLQGLAAVQILLSIGAEAEEPRRSESINRAMAGLSNEIDGLRLLMSDLRPQPLEELGLEDSLHSLGSVVTERHGIAVHVDVDLDERVDGDGLGKEVETTIYRVVQEALTNATKHSGADRVDVAVAEGDGRVVVTVADDGSGFDPGDGTDGLGLLGIRERSSLLGGKAEIDSSPGGGTRIRASLPLATR